MNELKQAWSDTLDEPDVQPSLSNVDGTSLLFGQVERVDLPVILSSLPVKAEVDKLVRWFFDCTNFPLAIPRTYIDSYQSRRLPISSYHTSTDLYARGICTPWMSFG